MFGRKKEHHEFALAEDALVYEGEKYAFTQFMHIDFHWQRTIQKTNFVKVGEANTVTFMITMANGTSKALQIDERTWFHGINRNRKDDMGVMLEVYEELSRLTFPARAGRYLSELRSKGYFTYVENRFTPPKTFQIGDHLFVASECNFLKHPTYIEIRRKNENFGEKFSRIAWRVPSFTTIRDRDCIFYLLDKYYGLRWT